MKTNTLAFSVKAGDFIKCVSGCLMRVDDTNWVRTWNVDTNTPGEVQDISLKSVALTTEGTLFRNSHRYSGTYKRHMTTAEIMKFKLLVGC